MAGDRCEECGYAYDALGRDELVPTLLELAADHRLRLGGVDTGLLRRRPEPDVWSVLEYACHVRDMLDVQRSRVLLAQQEDTPEFVPMGRDERAVRDRYNEQEPAAVAAELVQAAAALAATLDGLDERGWERTGVYGFPSRAVRTMDWVARHTVHELHHHLQDIDRQRG